MAVRIDRSLLSEDMVVRIRRELVLTPSVDASVGYASANKGLVLYRSDEKYLYLPYHWYSAMSGRAASNADWFVRHENMKFTLELRPEQIAMVGQAGEQLDRWGSTLLSARTGAGKTCMAAYLACRYGLLTLVVISLTPLIASWTKTFKDFTGCRVWVVGEGDMPADGFDVVICMTGRFGQLPQDVVESLGFVVFDEAHLLATPSRVPVLLGTTPAYVLCLSATLERSDLMHRAIHLVCGEHRTHRDNTKVVGLYRCRTGILVKQEQNSQGRLDFGKLINCQVESDERNKAAVKLIGGRLKDRKVLVFVWRQRHARKLEEMLRDAGESVACMTGSAKTYRDSRILTATIGKCGVGFDAAMVAQDYGGKPFDAIVMMGSAKSSALLVQVIGRCRGPTCDVYYLVDENGLCETHFKACVRAMKGRASNPIDLDMREI